jgi:hypothetical protein
LLLVMWSYLRSKGGAPTKLLQHHPMRLKKERQDFVDGAPRVPDLQGSIVRA